MCSIAGSLDKDEVKAMLKKMEHRAPDGGKIIDEGGFYVGNERLAIIDLISKDLSPFKGGSHILAFNGEIYNYLELRKILEKKGHIFRTTSDTEVLSKAFEQWGLDCLDKLNGMFAFAILDKNRIILARDIAGEKPLYYRKKPFSFASEAKALNWDCYELPPAHYLIYDFSDKNITLGKWWDFKPREIYLPNAEEELEYLLKDSVRLRTRSDVPYGLYLSGGIDSALIATFHKFEHTFTYKDENYTEKDFNKVFEKITTHLDFPVSSFSSFGLWKLAEEASKKVKVVLSGEGADELFGGYVRYLPNALYEQALKRFPSYVSMFPVKKNLNQWCWEEFNGNLRELLRMGDRMASAFGIENRCPFLDRRIIEFAFSIPPELKIRGFDTKYLLRKILKRRNPNYKFEEKRGLFCSVNKWLGVTSEGFGKKTYLKKQKEIYEKNLASK